VKLLVKMALADAIAMNHGFCIGGGLAIAVECDIRTANEEGRFGIPAARLGLGYGASGVKRLIVPVGSSFTKEISSTARHFSAGSRDMGPVNRVAPPLSISRKYYPSVLRRH
jgi:enoyl-CoA hydratase/carnithine racemase